MLKRMSFAARAGAVVGTLALTAGGLALSAAPASAAACYDTAKPFSKTDHTTGHFPSSSRLTTTSNCSDINVKISSPSVKYVKVCFYPSSGGSSCQASFTRMEAGRWYAVATGVANGTKYRLYFSTFGNVSGVIAA